MENLTELIASEIKKQYKSVRRFAMHIGIPQTTLFSVLKNGISGTAFDTVVKICQTLGINVINLKRPLNGKQNVWKYQNGEEKSDSDGREKDV